jgi:hypothetical protein
MSLVGPGVTSGRVGAPAAARPGRTRLRLLVAVVAVAADAAAALLITSHGAAVTAVGIASAALAWVLVGRLTSGQPRSARRAFEDSEQR